MNQQRGPVMLLYDDWRRTFDSVDRGAQLWGTRQRVYAAIAHRTDRRLPSLPALLASTKVSKRAFYKHFGIGSTIKLVDDEPMAVAVIEAKEWSWAPYRHGVRDVTRQLHLTPRVLLESVLRAVAEWAADYPALAGYLNARPPASAVSLAAGALAGLDGDVDASDDIVRAAMRRACDTSLSESSLGVLRAVGPAIDMAIRGNDDTPTGSQQAVVIEILSDYAHQLITGAAPAPAAHADVLTLLERLRTLIRETA